ncbi:MBL fold metallo-hydrolase [Parahaliea mediterranea]|uniref:MBL fold metallo-hydrolase n=1 Tax=Parahaliea mediterranea TaxID=651086 RepID=A0A939DC72_9GAMM|nr:MBL fold metallo-hydrolase [Parahaliea mediterranea]MBN7795471.1 MBL fold metallo-hydrolase [Parahaliea mediterranea]
MRNILSAPCATLAAVLAAASPAFAETASTPEVAMSKLPAPLHLLQGKGGNVVASVGEDGVLIVDDDYTEYAPAYDRALNGLAGEGEGTPRFVINTHWHFDHTGGNTYWGERGAVIVAHDNVYRRMSTRQEMKALDRVIEPSPRPALPVVTYGDSVALRFNGGAVEVQHYPRGHTDGDSVVYFVEQNVVHMGDHFFKDRFPFIDLGSGGSVRGYLNNVTAVLQRIDNDTVVVPGHGSLANKADLERYAGMLEATATLVVERLEDGASVDDIVARGLGQRWSSWGAGFIDEATWIRTVASSVKK